MYKLSFFPDSFSQPKQYQKMIFFIDYPGEKYSIIVCPTIRFSVFCSLFGKLFCMIRPWAGRISILIFGVNPSGSGCVFCLKPGFFFWKVCLVLSTGSAKTRHQQQSIYVCVFYHLFTQQPPLRGARL